MELSIRGLLSTTSIYKKRKRKKRVAMWAVREEVATTVPMHSRSHRNSHTLFIINCRMVFLTHAPEITNLSLHSIPPPPAPYFFPHKLHPSSSVKTVTPTYGFFANYCTRESLNRIPPPSLRRFSCPFRRILCSLPPLFPGPP